MKNKGYAGGGCGEGEGEGGGAGLANKKYYGRCANGEFFKEHPIIKLPAIRIKLNWLPCLRLNLNSNFAVTLDYLLVTHAGSKA